MNLRCEEVDELVTRYVDGELDVIAARAVTSHIAVCPRCRHSVDAEQSARELLQGASPRLSPAAPASLRARVSRSLPASTRRRVSWWQWVAVAAAVVVAAMGGLTLAGIVRPTPVFAAEVALDHRKCWLAGPEREGTTPAALEPSWRDWQGWSLEVPDGHSVNGLSLIGYRRCYLTEGRAAHLMYALNGKHVSLFVMPQQLDIARSQLEMFGQDAVVWTSHGRTFALVGETEVASRDAFAVMAGSLEHELDEAGQRR